MKRVFLLFIVLLLCSLSGCKKKGGQYNVTFVNGEQQETIKYNENEKVVFETLSQEGYIFNGWTLNGAIVEEHTVVSDVTFIASFSKLKYQVSFEIDGVNQSQEYEYGESVEFPVATKEGHNFVGWIVNGELVNNYVIKGETKFVASFEKQKFDVTFIVNSDIIVKSYEYGDFVEFPEATLEGFKFIGWQLDNDIIDKYQVVDNVTIIASFEEIDYIELAKAYLTTYLPVETIEDIVLPTEFLNVTISWKTSNAKAITTLGKVVQQEYKANVTLTATLTYNGSSENVKYKVVVPKLDDEVILRRVLETYKFNSEIVNHKLTLNTDFSTNNSTITCIWESLNKEFLSNTGNILSYSDTEQAVSIKLTLVLRETSISETYDVVIPALSTEELIDLALANANIESCVTSTKAYLPTEFEYDLVGTWSSADTSIIDNNGNVKVTSNSYKEVKMTLTLYKISGEEVKQMEYTFKVHNKTHLPIVHAKDFNEANMNNVELQNGRLVLKDGQTYGEYESDILETINFNNCVPSWAAISSTNATVEFQIKARVNAAWSKYVTYCNGGWGLGLQNKSYDTSDSLVKLSTDEFMVLNSKSADAIQFKLILRRTNSSSDSPKVSLCSFALKGTNYTAPTYSLNDLPSNVKHVVPKLYQGAVPSIGNSICSPTSSTMLLKFKGMDFTANDSQYEHRYIAGLAKDYGNNIFGNWVYNTVTMSAYGFNSYVARFYSVAELCHHIATVGPVACSMKGQMTSDMKDYYTAGHLITIIGYEYNNGVLTLISNDPNVPSVECRYSESVFTTTWRNISYIIE